MPIIIPFNSVLRGTVLDAKGWPRIQGTENNSGLISDKAPALTYNISEKRITLPYNMGGDNNGVTTEVVMETINGITYAYVWYNNHPHACLAKINCATQAIVWNVTVYTNSASSEPLGYPATPVIDLNNRCLYAGANEKIYRITDIDSSTPVVTNIYTLPEARVRTPLTLYGPYLYFGACFDDPTQASTYYQLTVVGTWVVRTIKTASHGFAKSGALVRGSRVYFGDLAGRIHIRNIGNAFISGASLDLTTATGGTINAGAVYSSMVLGKNGNLYFTSAGGYLWECAFGVGNALTILRRATLNGPSYSTPVLTNNDVIYVTCAPNASTGYVQRLYLESFTPTVIWNYNRITASPIVYSVSTGPVGQRYDYIYFTSNTATGSAYCIRLAPNTGDVQTMWQTNTYTNTYAVAGFAAHNSYLVYADGNRNVFIITAP